MQPLREVLSHEIAVEPIGISPHHAIDFFGLAGAEGLARVETPDAGQQSLASQDFVNAGNAAGKIVGGIEQRGVDVGQSDAV